MTASSCAFSSAVSGSPVKSFTTIIFDSSPSEGDLIGVSLGIAGMAPPGASGISRGNCPPLQLGGNSRPIPKCRCLSGSSSGKYLDLLQGLVVEARPGGRGATAAIWGTTIGPVLTHPVRASIGVSWQGLRHGVANWRQRQGD